MNTHLSAPTSRGSGIGLSVRALGRCLLLLALWPVSIALYIAIWITVDLIPLGIGILLVPVAVKALRSLAEWKRRMVHQWSGIRVESPYLPLPPAEPGFRGRFDEAVRLVKDPGTWRDVAWLLMDLCVSPMLALFSMATVIGGLLGLAMPIIWEPFAKNWSDGSFYLFVPVNETTAPFMPIPGLLILLTGLLLAPWWVKLHSRFVRWALGPTKRTRMAALSQTRRETRDSSAAELRRIERDLHDGTQARLVAMGMTINTAQAMMRSNPEAAEALLTEAKNASVTALGELRDLVRGIHPPVLADRGLGDAVRALAADCAISAEVNVEIPERVGPALESAAYFAVSELLGNVVKHSGANRVDIDLRVENGELRISVTDDGRGGANPETGTGLRGIERRLAAFDGLLVIQSPIGGPTSAHITLPVES
mgnify:FL=1